MMTPKVAVLSLTGYDAARPGAPWGLCRLWSQLAVAVSKRERYSPYHPGFVVNVYS